MPHLINKEGEPNKVLRGPISLHKWKKEAYSRGTREPKCFAPASTQFLAYKWMLLISKEGREDLLLKALAFVSFQISQQASMRSEETALLR